MVHPSFPLESKEGHVADKILYTIDPKYEEEVSGCTACVGLLTDDKIYVVSILPDNFTDLPKLTRENCRPMLVTPEACWV